ncbi:unnamed protein product [Spodoptera exigua]|nr:unnamed protein product [Spodoptera exigua]
MADNISFRGHSQERNHIYDLFKRTVSHGESHSALMLGPRGSGKTTLINSVLNQISKEVDLSNDAIIVRLNGLIHYDEKIALKSITAQMQLENAVGDRVFGTFAENLAFLLSCLQSGADRRCKSVTNRLDVMELLEKRVKSRFSHRHLFIFPNEHDSQRAPQYKYKDVLVQLLSLPVQKTVKKKSRSRRNTVSDDMETDAALDNSLPPHILARYPDFDQLNPDFILDWNQHITGMAEDYKLIDCLEKLSYYSVNEQIFRNILFELVSKLSCDSPYIDVSDLSAIIDKTVAPEHRVKLLQSLSILELSLVIAMKHGMEIFDGQPMNFEMVLHRYTKFANSNSSTQTVPRPVILKAFEHLQELEIIMPVKTTDSIYNGSETTANRVQKEYKLYTLAVPNEDISDAVKNFKALPTEINHWFNNSVV